MRKILRICAGVLICLALLGIQAGSVWATGEQSVKELIGRDGDDLINRMIFQRLEEGAGRSRLQFSEAEIFLQVYSRASVFGWDENGFLEKRQGFQLPESDEFSSCLLSADGNKLTYNGYDQQDDIINENGAFYIFERNQEGGYKLQQKLIASDSEPDLSDGFGRYAFCLGDLMVVGARYRSVRGIVGGTGHGQFYVFERNENGVWQEKQILEPQYQFSEPEPNDIWFTSAAIWNNCIIISSEKGAFIFERDSNGVWRQSIILTNQEKYTNFGKAKIEENYIYFSTQTNTYMYTYQNGVWQQKQTIPGTDMDIFGEYAMTRYSNIIYVFERNQDGSWKQKQKINGNDIQISGNYAIVNASDAVYIFERNPDGIWQQKQELTKNIEKVSCYNMIIKDDYAGFISEGSDYYLRAHIFKRNQNGIWQQKIQSNPYYGIVSYGNLYFCSNSIIHCTENAIYTYPKSPKSLTTDEFITPGNKKYLVFKVARNSTIPSRDEITNRICFEVVGLKQNVTNPYEMEEEIYSLPLNNGFYFEGFTHVYYIVDISELKTRYLSECQNKFQLGDGGLGYSIYERVALRVRYDAPITVNNLKDVYVTDDATITEKDITFDIQPAYGSAEIKWTDVNPDWISGYQVIVKDTPGQPDNSISDPAPVKVPYISKTNLSAKKVYYVWVRPINIQGVAGPWTSQQFSPKAEATTFDSIQSYPVSSFKDGILSYSIKLKVNEADAASYVLKRKLYNSSNDLEQLGEYSHDDVTTGFCDGGEQLQKHGKYEYYVYTKNALGELSGNFGTIVMNVKNIEPLPFEVPEPYKWRKTEVKKNLSLKLGPKYDPEGDPVTYKLYIRTPGAQDERVIVSRTPQADNELLDVNNTFNDKTTYEWQIRCIDNPYGSIEVVNSGWVKTAIDTDAILVITKNILGISPSGTKKQPLNFEVEINPAKTYTGYQWDFGDGTAVVTGDKVTHTYYNLNTYPVTVTAMEGNVPHKGGEDIAIVNTYAGRLFDNENWSGLHGVKGEVVVPDGLTLTIMPRTEIQMQAEAGLKVAGTLKAVDTGSNGAIKFDWQQDQNRWKGMRFEGSSVGDLRGVTIRHAKTGILVEGESLRLNLNSVTFDSDEVGIDYYSGNVVANQCNLLNNTQYGINVNGEVYPTNTYCIFKGNLINYKDSLGALSETDVNELPGNMGNEFQ